MGVDSYNIVFGEKVTEFNGESYDNLNVNQLCNNNSDDVITNTLYDHSKKDRYCYVGKYSRFLGRVDEDYAYKVFIKPDTKDGVETMQSLKRLLRLLTLNFQTITIYILPKGWSKIIQRLEAITST